MSFQSQLDPQTYARVRSNTWPGIEREATAEAKPPSRRNAWGSLSYADLITRAISSSPNQKATLIQIYDWLVENVPYFRQRSDKASSAGWKNSIRHNLSLQNKFMRVQNEETGKSSWWMINHQAKEKTGRRRCATMDNQKAERKRQTVRKKSETLKRIKEEVTPDSPWNQQGNTPQLLRTQSFIQPGPSTSSYIENTTNPQTDQNYNHLVASFQYGMTLYYPSTQMSHVNNAAMANVSQLNNSAMPVMTGGSAQTQNVSNVDDLIMDLNPIHLPFEIDVEGIIKKELEIDGRLDFV